MSGSRWGFSWHPRRWALARERALWDCGCEAVVGWLGPLALTRVRSGPNCAGMERGGPGRPAPVVIYSHYASSLVRVLGVACVALGVLALILAAWRH